jgi:hypothetical protein
MIEVEGPDGSSFEFPDDMAHSAIEAALQHHYAAAAPVSTGEDLARSAGSGLVTGAAGIPGAPGDAQAILKSHNPFDWLADKYRAFDPKQAAKNEALAGKMGRTSDLGAPIDFPTTEEIKAKTGLSATDYTPQTEGGRITKGIATMVPGALTGGPRTGGGLAADLGRYAVAPALAVEGIDKLDIPEPYKGPAKMLASITASALAGKAISPNASHAPEASREAYAGQVARLEQEGIPVSAGERADSRGLRIAEDELNPEHYKAKNEAVTRAATRVVPGFETPVINHGAGGTIDTMLHTTGRRFDDLSARNTLVPDAGMGVDIMNLRREFTRNPNLYDAGVVKAVDGEANALRDAFATSMRQTGQPALTGAQYQRLRSSVNTAARTTENPQKAQALHEFVSILDDGMERSIARTNPADAGAWGAARRDYKNALVIEDAGKSSRAAGSVNYITPASLESAAAKVYGRRAHERGYDPFDWAPAAKSVLKVEPNSGTAHRTHVSDYITGVTRAVGAGAGFAAGHAVGGGSEGGVAGLLLGQDAGARLVDPAARAALRSLVHSGAGQAYLGNQLLAGRQGVRSIPGLLMAAEAARQ